jgi:superfamily I DNA and/or RNA helicase
VDSSQGDEADIVALSCVRSNPNGDVGFIAGVNGTKRTCVALSRPREALAIVGDPTAVAKQGCKLARAFPRQQLSKKSLKPPGRRQLHQKTAAGYDSDNEKNEE